MRRASTKIAAALFTALVAGCGSVAPQPTTPEGGYCYSIGGPFRPTLTCTTSSIPSPPVEDEAKRFISRPDVVTLYIVRRHSVDTAYHVLIDIDGRAKVETIPYSLVRVSLAPGVHRLRMDWAGQTQPWEFEGGAGDVRFVEIDGAAWAWNTYFRWAADDPKGARQRATGTRLIADLRLE